MTKPEWDPENPDKLDAEHEPFYPKANPWGVLTFIGLAAAIVVAGLVFKACMG